MAFLLVPPGYLGPPDWEPETLFTMKEREIYVTTLLYQAKETNIILSPVLSGHIHRRHNK